MERTVDSQIQALYDKIQKKTISVADATLELERIRAWYRSQQPKTRGLQLPTPSDQLRPLREYDFSDPFLQDHQLGQDPILLGVTFASLALELGIGQLAEGEALEIKQLNFAAPAKIEQGNRLAITIQSSVSDTKAHGFEALFRIAPDQPWQIGATGSLTAVPSLTNAIDIAANIQNMEALKDFEWIYEFNQSVHLGSSYRIIHRLYRDPILQEAIASIQLQETKEKASSGYGLSPLLINSAFLTLIPLLDRNALSDAYIPFGIKRLVLHTAMVGNRCWVKVKIQKQSSELILFDAQLLDEKGTFIAEFQGCSLKRIRENTSIVDSSQSEKLKQENMNFSSQSINGVEAVESYLFSQLNQLGASHLTRKQRKRNLMDLGLESLQLVNLAKSIEHALSIELDPTLFFEYPSVAELSEYLWQHHRSALESLVVRVAHSSIDSEQASSTVQKPLGNKDSAKEPTQRLVDQHSKTQRPISNVSTNHEDIAIIGMKGQFGEAKDLEQYWANILEDRECIKEIPKDHWDVDPWYSSDPEAHDKTYSKWGSFLQGIEYFDADFFRMSRREAQWMDPQVRLLLQSVYATAEDACVAKSIRSTNTGVFIGSCFNEYFDKMTEMELAMDPYMATGMGSIAANRISFWFDFKGPSLMFNTACSSSLVALHAACVSLRYGECDMAFVGGSNLLLSSWHYRYFSAISALSPTGRCHTFDTKADGYVPGECVATLLLKPLSKALADGDPIQGVIKGAAALHGGYTPSLTAPSVAGEENVILQAWQNAGIDPRSLSYIEAHGTGTKLGDPIEVNALKRAFGRFTQDQYFCHLGSAKANIGHVEGAAGIAGVLKVLQQMHHQTIPPLGHFEEQNPHIDLNSSPFVLDTEPSQWASEHKPRMAGVSSFGFSGTNAHAVLEEFIDEREFQIHQGQWVLIPVSAKNEERLQAQIDQLIHFISVAQPDLVSLAYSLQIGREAMATRAIFKVNSLDVLLEQLQAWKANSSETSLIETKLSVDQAMEAQDLSSLAAHWLAMAEAEEDLDWGLLYQADKPLPARISLPSYAFAAQRYWLDELQPESQAITTLNTYTEHWLPVEDLPTNDSVQHLVCLVQNKGLRKSLTKKLRIQYPNTALYFVGDSALEPSNSSQQSWIACFNELSKKINGRCHLLYGWPAEQVKWASDPSPILDIIKAIQGSSLTVERLLLAGIAHSPLDRCYLESWIGFERSLPAIEKNFDVQVAIQTDSKKTLTAWLPELVQQLGDAQAKSRLYDQGKIFQLQIESVNVTEQSQTFSLETFETVFITGGTGALGMMLATELSQRARHSKSTQVNLVLNGRSVLTPEQQDAIGALRHSHCHVHYLQADCTDAKAMNRGLADILPHSGPIKTLIHAAGVMPNSTLYESTFSDFKRVLETKIASTITLEKILSKQSLKYVCYYASSSAILGDMGAASYSIANRFQQAFSRHVQSQSGARVVAIQWPLWKEGGMQVGEKATTDFYLASTGQRLLESQEGIQMLEKILASDLDQVLVLAGERQRLGVLLNNIYLPKSNSEPSHSQIDPIATDRKAISGNRPELKGLSLPQKLMWDLKDLASKPLNAKRQSLSEESNLADFGFDSLSLAEFARLLNKAFHLSLSPEVFFGQSTLAKLSNYLLTKFPDAVQACYPENPNAIGNPQPAVTPTLNSVSKQHSAAGISGLGLSASQEPIAIIGMSGRFPGARNVDELWTLLSEGKDAVTEIPADRFDWHQYDGDHRQDPTKTPCHWMGAIPGIAEFDPLFFEMAPKEAKYLDPRQRLLLQEAWNALEHAGVGPQQIASKKIGMFVGVEEGDFQRIVGEESLTSNHNGILASRLAYFLNLTGPTMAINTACSSALVALHQAQLSLRNQECDLAIVAGVNLIFSPDAFVGMTHAGMLSTDGKCFTFDQRANGMVPGEAVCAVVLKPLAMAEADADVIHATIRGSGVNYDGKTNGITAPSGVSQAQLLQEVYARADVSTRDIDYIVTHGTGTQLGDPVEIHALNEVFQNDPVGHCALTSTKTNVGHTFAASGLVSLISLVEALKHKTIPASLHCEFPSEHVDWQMSPFYVNTQNTPWPDNETGQSSERLGAVSAFGMSGTNAHVVLQSYAQTPPTSDFIKPCYLIALSARASDQLSDKVQDLLNHLRANTYSQEALASISYSLLEGRHHFRHRLAIVASDLEELEYSLDCFLQGEARPNLLQAEVERGFKPQTTLTRYLGQMLEDSRKATEPEARELFLGLADLYRQGYEIQAWRLFADQSNGLVPHKVALPGYPFARETYWPDVSTAPIMLLGADAVPSKSKATIALHPLVHQNRSTFYQQHYFTEFTGAERLLQEHRIGDRFIFPATGYLSLAQAAVSMALESAIDNIQLENVVWLSPFYFDANSQSNHLNSTAPQGLHCVLEVMSEHRVRFDIFSELQGQQQMHAQGHALIGGALAPIEPLPMTHNKKTDWQPGSVTELYNTFEALGLQYGESFRAVKAFELSNDHARGWLTAQGLDDALAGVWLPPGLLDSAFHIAAAIDLKRSQNPEPKLPFALEKLRLIRPLEKALQEGDIQVLAVQKSEHNSVKVDVQLLDNSGQLLATVTGYSCRSLSVASQDMITDNAKAEPVDISNVGAWVRTPSWQAHNGNDISIPNDAAVMTLLVNFPKTTAEHIKKRLKGSTQLISLAQDSSHAQAFIQAVKTLFKRLKQRMQTGPKSGYVQVFVAGSQQDQRLLALEGLLNTLHIEQPALNVGLVSMDEDMALPRLVDTVVRLNALHNVQPLKVMASGNIYERHWQEQPFTQDRVEVVEFIWREEGVYAITGGANGLGFLFAQHIAQRSPHARIYLAGRTALDSAIQTKLERLESLGAQAFYQSLDVSDSAQVQHWIDDIYHQQKSLNGVIHSAGLIQDSLMVKKTSSEFERVLIPKILGIEALDHAIGTRPLDFLLCCSSQAAMGNLGQADYATANAYMDAYMTARQQWVIEGKRKGRSISVNWPMWQDGGMQLPPAILDSMQTTLGMVPLPSEQGLALLDQLLKQPAIVQAWVQYGELDKLQAIERSQTEDRNSAGQTVTPIQPAFENPAVAVDPSALKSRITAYITEVIAKVTQVNAQQIHPEEKFEAYGFDSIMAVGATTEFEKRLGPLPKTLLFEHVNIAGMAEHFAKEYADAFMAPEVKAENAAITHSNQSQNKPLSKSLASKKSRVLTNSKLPQTEVIADEDLGQQIAVIGIGGYYPEADNIEAFWDNLVNGKNCMSDFPAERWDHSKIYYKDRSVLGKTTCKNGSFVQDVDKFDYSYFKMPKVFADYASPEVRLFLQAAVHTFEDAGYSKESMLSQFGGDVAVLMGTMANDYHYFGFESSLSKGSMVSGSGMATIPMMVSYFYGFTGPSMFIDTMCSSSSSCIHMAYQMLRNGETQMVLAGATNLMYHPYTTVSTSQGNFTSITATAVNSYGVGADGTVVGEGIGAVLLKPLDKALADRDQIYGVIKGSAITNAGERNGFNVPTPDLQALAIQKATAQAKVDPSTLSYIEGHGSGTKLGDPIELLGLTKAFGDSSKEKQYCYLGSVKSNIGHLLAASGVAGLTKVLLQLKHRKIVPSIHSETLNPDIDFANTPFKVSQTLTEWVAPQRMEKGVLTRLPRRAGITSIAAGGMNSHIVVEEFSGYEQPEGQIDPDNLVFVFSVHKLAQFKDNLEAMQQWLLTNQPNLNQLAYCLQVGKNSLRNRLVIRCKTQTALLAAIKACLQGRYDNGDEYQLYYRFPENASEQLGNFEASQNAIDAKLNDWLQGRSQVNWAELYSQKPVRMSLPNYRFEKSRCWYAELGEESNILHPVMPLQRIHPLVAENCSTTAPFATFKTPWIEQFLLDYCYRQSAKLRFSPLNFAEVAVALSQHLHSDKVNQYQISCAFEHHIQDWSKISELEYRVYDVDADQIEVEFDVKRVDDQITPLGFAVLNPMRADQFSQTIERAQTKALLQSIVPTDAQRISAEEVQQRFEKMAFNFSPYSEAIGDLLITSDGLRLDSPIPTLSQNQDTKHLQLPPYIANTIDKAIALLLFELSDQIPEQTVIQNIEQLCIYGTFKNSISVVLTDVQLKDELSFSLWVSDSQGKLGVHADCIRLFLTESQRANIKRSHPLFGENVRSGKVRENAEPISIQRPTAQQPKVEENLEVDSRKDQVLAFIRQELIQKLGFSESELKGTSQIQDLGLDSIMVVKLTDSINKKFGTKLMPDTFYENQALAELVAKVDMA